MRGEKWRGREKREGDEEEEGMRNGDSKERDI